MTDTQFYLNKEKNNYNENVDILEKDFFIKQNLAHDLELEELCDTNLVELDGEEVDSNFDDLSLVELDDLSLAELDDAELTELDDSNLSEVEYIIEEKNQIDNDSSALNQNHKLYIPKNVLSAGQIINILRRMLHEVNSQYIELAELTSFCAIKVFDYAKLNGKLKTDINRNELILLSLFYTIGAYREELKFSPDEKNEKSKFSIFLYSYFFLKNMTPLKDAAEAVLLYNYKYEDAKNLNSKYVEVASLIFTCMRICLKFKKLYSNNDICSKDIFSSEFIKKEKSLYNPLYVDLFIQANHDEQIINKIKGKDYFYLLDDYCNTLIFDYDDTFTLLKMMVYAVDFVSTSTVTHIISASFLSTEICKLMNLTDSEVDEVFTAALIHDMGKLSVDMNILESALKLSDEEKNKMKTHVEHGIKLCSSIVGTKIADIAFRHHETIDGKGYPLHLTGKDLSLQQKIMTTSDILSALTDSRNYKPSYSKEKTLCILQNLVEENKLERVLVEKIKDNYDMIFANTKNRRPMLTTNLGFVMVEYMMLKDCTSIPELFKAIREPIL